MSQYDIREEDVKIVHASRISESKKDSFSYNLRKTEKGWIIMYDHYNVDDGLVETQKYHLPDDIVDIITTYQAKEKLKS